MFYVFLLRIGCDQSEIIRISEPIKKHWANHKSLNLNDLLSDGPYKEQYRKEMIDWSDEARRENPNFFCSEAFKTGKIHFGFGFYVWVMFIYFFSHKTNNNCQ